MKRNVLGLALAMLPIAQEAAAQDERRPGLEGIYTDRHLTAPRNSLVAIIGPGQTPLLSQRYGDRIWDGGVAYQRSELNAAGGGPSVESVWARGGVAFGLFDHLEAGALFLTFRLHPDVTFSDFPVYLTYSWTLDNVDIGARFSFTPAPETSWALNPGIPVLVRLGNARIDTGIFSYVYFAEPVVGGLHAPLRLSYNFNPHIFAALDTGYVDPDFVAGNDRALSLGGLAGYTLLVGKRLVDITASFTFDDFVLFEPPAGLDPIHVGTYRALAGITLHTLVL